MIGPSDIKRGMLLEIDGTPWLVVDVASQTPSARGASTITKVKVRNLISGQFLSKSYRGGETIETAEVERRPIQYLYCDGEEYIFMDEESYDQISLHADMLGELVGYLKDGMSLKSLIFNEKVVSIELPNTVELEIIETTPNIKGATAQAQLKPATLETGIQIMVPPYLATGEKIRVDTRTGKFVERVRN